MRKCITARVIFPLYQDNSLIHFHSAVTIKQEWHSVQHINVGITRLKLTRLSTFGLPSGQDDHPFNPFIGRNLGTDLDVDEGVLDLCPLNFCAESDC